MDGIVPGPRESGSRTRAGASVGRGLGGLPFPETRRACDAQAAAVAAPASGLLMTGRQKRRPIPSSSFSSFSVSAG